MMRLTGRPDDRSAIVRAIFLSLMALLLIYLELR